MGVGYPFEGASGQLYQYVLIDTSSAALLPRQSGNYVFARSFGTLAPTVIYVGDARSIYGAITGEPLWNAAKRDHDANCLYVHLRNDEQARHDEQLDLVRKYRPPMNVRDTVAEDQE